MKKFTLAFILLIISATNFIIAQPGFTSNLLFVAKLEGDQEVPPITTTAVGEASFALNATHDTMCVNVTVKGLTGAMTGAHIHEGPIGGTGGIIVDLSGSIVGTRISTIITAPQLTSDFIAKMMGNAYYINVHTAANPNGEIRGQIGLEADIPMTASLGGAQETPPVATNATGLATFDLSRSMISLKIKAHFENLSGGITAIHLHTGAVGISGPPVVDLSGGLHGNNLDTTLDSIPFITDLMNGNIYLNVHTAANPNGEIRGQVLKQLSMSFDASLDGTQESPAVATAATGLGMMTFSAAGDSIWYDFIAEGLSGTPTNAHFHTGAPGVSGPVAINLSAGINGNRIKGVATNIPAGFMDDCLRGNVYINIHTAANSGGEIRGQLRRYVREGFTYTIDATQETPPTSSSGIGSGIASIDRDIDNLHFRMIVDGLSGPITNAHFHNAPADTSGPIIFSLTPYFTLTGTSDVAFNYWKNTDGFDSLMADMFFSNMVYVNIHTAAFANGEIRGQIIRGGNCSNLSTGIHAVVPMALDFNIFPNPVSNEDLNISFDGLVNDNGVISVYDLSGRKILDKEVAVQKGKNSFSISTGFQPGMYLLRFAIGNNEQMISSFIKN